MIVVAYDPKSRAQCAFCLDPQGVVLLMSDNRQGYAVEIHVCAQCAQGLKHSLETLEKKIL